MEFSEFRSVDIFILANEETELLRKTVEEVSKCCSDDDISKLWIIAKSNTCAAFFEGQKMINEGLHKKLKMYMQKSTDLISCLYEITSLIETSHFIIMASDMETDPRDVRKFIDLAKDKPGSIICAAKWIEDSQVTGYGKFHEFGSRTMNTFISLLFGKKVKDPFSTYQIYPKEVFDMMHFSNSKKFLYEFTLKPLSMGIDYIELPTKYVKRTIGKSNFNYFMLFYVAFNFCITAVKLRFSSKENNIWKTIQKN